MPGVCGKPHCGGAWHAVHSQAYPRSIDRASSRAMYAGSHRNLSPLATGQQGPRPAAPPVTLALVTSFLRMAPRHEPPATHPSCTASHPQANGARPIRQRASQQRGPGSGSAGLGQRQTRAAPVSYAWIRVPERPAMASAALSSDPMTQVRPGRLSANLMAALTFGSMEPLPNCPSLR